MTSVFSQEPGPHRSPAAVPRAPRFRNAHCTLNQGFRSGELATGCCARDQGSCSGSIYRRPESPATPQGRERKSCCWSCQSGEEGAGPPSDGCEAGVAKPQRLGGKIGKKRHFTVSELYSYSVHVNSFLFFVSKKPPGTVLKGDRG